MAASEVNALCDASDESLQALCDHSAAQGALLARVAATLKTFSGAPVSASSLQPLLDLAIELNPELRLMVICAWCGRVMAPGCLPASHGICPGCRDRAFAER